MLASAGASSKLVTTYRRVCPSLPSPPFSLSLSLRRSISLSPSLFPPPRSSFTSILDFFLSASYRLCSTARPVPPPFPNNGRRGIQATTG